MLQDAISSNGYLLSQKDGASAISEARTQQLIDTDYRKIKSPRIIWYLTNIGKGSNVADTLKTSRTIQDGDLILIRRGTGAIEEFIVPVAGTTAITDAPLIPSMTNYSLPYGLAINYGSSNAWYAFDGSNTTYADIPVNSSLGYQFYGNVPHIVTAFYIKGAQSYDYYFEIEASTNGVDWTVIHTTGKIEGNEILAGGTYIIDNPGSYSYYRLKCATGSQSIYRPYHFQLLGDGVQIDTTTTTQGDVPNIAFLYNDEVKYNEVTLSKASMDAIYGKNYDRLYVYTKYDDCEFYPTREIITTYNFKTAGNLALEQTGEIYDLWLKQGNATMTSNTTPNDTVSFGGVDAPATSNAYLVYDGDNTTEAYSVATGALGVVDLEHIYEFDVATTCYAIEMTTSLASQAPAEYYVWGSFDGTSWTELQHVIQGIASNDLVRKQYFYNADYDAYKFYKVHVVKGNTENDFVSAKQYVLLEEDPS